MSLPKGRQKFSVSAIKKKALNPGVFGCLLLKEDACVKYRTHLLPPGKPKIILRISNFISIGYADIDSS